MKDVFEEFIQMYERSKRSSTKQVSSENSKAKQKAIILTWNINYGNCLLQTYSLCDDSKTIFFVEMSCIHGVILLQFQKSTDEKNEREISKDTDVGTAKQVKVYLEEL